MNKDFVKYEEALELKGLGFDEPCFKCENEEEDTISYSDYNSYLMDNRDVTDFVKIPTYSQAFRWFREKYYLTWEHQFDDGNICLFVGEITYPDTSLRFFKAVEVKQDGYNEAYEEAELACLRHLIKLVKEGGK
jgi:hypothetical protein